MVGGNKKEFFVYADAEAKRGVLKLNYPLEHGVWDDGKNMETCFH